MGSTYQTVLAVGEGPDIRRTLDAMGVEAFVRQVAAGRWAVAPREDEHGWAETEAIAEQLSRSPGGIAVSFQVHDSDALVALLFGDGRLSHSYVSDQSVLLEWWDEDDNEMLLNLLGWQWTGDGPPPQEAIGAEASVFAHLGIGEIDLAELQRSLSERQLLAERQHAAILRALNLDAQPLTTAYRLSRPADNAIGEAV